jgi:hypothetical protein
VLGADEPGYLLWGRSLEHRVFYLSVNAAVADAYLHRLSYVVISTGPNRWAAGEFARKGWTIRRLDGYWLLAVATNAGEGDCSR